jgi:hypothetical protein
MRILALAAVSLVIALAASLGSPAGAQRTPQAFPIVFHVGEDAAGAPLLDEAALTSALRETNRAMADANVCFTAHQVVALPGVSRLRDIRSRRALERLTTDGAVHVFVVDAIEDPRPSASTMRAAEAAGRELGGLLGGAHIPRRSGTPGTYVLVTAGGVHAWTPLAHELGHVMGESHVADVTNLMSYGEGRTGFDAAQLARMERRGRRMARARWVSSPAACP